MEWKDVLTPIAAIAGIWLGNRLAIGRSVADQLWEMRRSTYSFILAQMSEMDRLIKFMQPYIDQYGWPREAERFEEMDTELWTVREEIQKRVVADYLTMSAEARSIMEAFRGAGSIADDEPDPDTRNLLAHEALARQLQTYRPQLQALAIDELDDLRRGIVGRLWHRLQTGKRPVPLG